MQTLAPIVLFVYNRPELTLQTLECLSKNKESEASELYIFCDGPRPDANEEQLARIKKVREIVHSREWCNVVHILESDENKGLANSIIGGVTKVVKKEGKVIVLEDDLCVSPYFLKYMNEALELYERETEVLAIHGYLFPVKLPSDLQESTFFTRDPGCWGWATWERAWKLFEPDSKKLYDLIRLKGLRKDFTFWGGYPYMRMLRQQIAGDVDSWAIRWRAVAYLHHKLTLYPTISLVRNEGNVPDATHLYTGKENPYEVTLADQPVPVEKIQAKNNIEMEKVFGRFLKKNAGMDFYGKLKSRLSQMFKG